MRRGRKGRRRALKAEEGFQPGHHRPARDRGAVPRPHRRLWRGDGAGHHRPGRFRFSDRPGGGGAKPGGGGARPVPLHRRGSRGVARSSWKWRKARRRRRGGAGAGPAQDRGCFRAALAVARCRHPAGADAEAGIGRHGAGARDLPRHRRRSAHDSGNQPHGRGQQDLDGAYRMGCARRCRRAGPQLLCPGGRQRSGPERAGDGRHSHRRGRDGRDDSAKALVFGESEAWVYVQTAPRTFLRTKVDISQPMGEGYFVTASSRATRSWSAAPDCCWPMK